MFHHLEAAVVCLHVPFCCLFLSTLENDALVIMMARPTMAVAEVTASIVTVAVAVAVVGRFPFRLCYCARQLAKAVFHWHWRMNSCEIDEDYDLFAVALMLAINYDAFHFYRHWSSNHSNTSHLCRCRYSVEH